MYNAEKNYHDENYKDPVPVGICPICGEPVFPGDKCIEADGELIHADGIYKVYKDRYGKAISMSCTMAFIWDLCGQTDFEEMLGLEEKRAEG